MRRIADRIGLICVIALILFVSACSIKSVRKESGTAPTGSGTTTTSSTATQTGKPSPTIKPTATPTPTRKPTPTSKPTATPKPTVSPTPTPALDPTPEPIPLDYTRTDCVLTRSVSAKKLNGSKVTIAVGEILWVYTEARDGFVDENSRFFNYASEEILFDFSMNKYKTLMISGIPAFELFRSVEEALSEPVREIVIKPWVQTKGITENDKVTMKLDWDGDGIEDEIWFRKVEDQYSMDWGYQIDLQDHLFFKNGANGAVAHLLLVPDQTADSYERFEKNMDEWSDGRDDTDSNYYPVEYSDPWDRSGDSILLYQNSSGQNVIMVSTDISDLEIPDDTAITYFIKYEPISGFSTKSVLCAFEYQNGVFYKSDFSRVLGKTWTTKTAVELFDDYRYEHISTTTTYLKGYRDYTYALRSVVLEVYGSDGYVPERFPSGTIIFPVQTVIDSTGNGYLHVKLFDGHSARLKVEYDAQTESVLIAGQPQEDVFACLSVVMGPMP